MQDYRPDEERHIDIEGMVMKTPAPVDGNARVLVGRARPQPMSMEKDDFLHWRMEIAEPYPHVVHFGIVPNRGQGPAPFLHEIEQADEVAIKFDLTSRIDGFDGIFPTLETSLDRISITRPGIDDEQG